MGSSCAFVELFAPQAAHHGHRRDATARDATARNAAACNAAASLRCRRTRDATTLTMPPFSLLDRSIADRCTVSLRGTTSRLTLLNLGVVTSRLWSLNAPLSITRLPSERSCRPGLWDPVHVVLYTRYIARLYTRASLMIHDSFYILNLRLHITLMITLHPLH